MSPIRNGRGTRWLIAVAAFAVAAAAASTYALAGEGRVVEAPSAFGLWSPEHGLVGRTAYHPLRGSIWIYDSGHRLRLALRVKESVDSIQTIGRSTAIAEVNNGHRSRYLRTTDGGRHWQPLRLRYPTSFATARIGLGFRVYMAGNRGKMALLETRDAGRTWQRRPNPCQSGGLAFSALVDLVTPRLGWLMCLGQGGAGNEEKALFRTTDGGAHWQALARVPMTGHPRGGIASYGYPAGMSFTRGGFGILWESRGTLYVTRDGGAHWRAEPRVQRPEIDFGKGGAAFPNGRALLLLWDGAQPPARLVETRDYGRVWHHHGL